MDNLIWLVLGMAAVTYVPRLAPFLMLNGKKLPARLDAFLRCIPLAAIGALIFPSVLQATPEKPMASIFGMAFALLFGLWRGGIIIPVLGAVGLTYIMYAFV